MAREDYPGREGSTLSQSGKEGMRKAGEMAEAAAEKGSEISHRAGEEVASRLDDQKQRYSSSLRSVGEAIHHASSELRERDENTVARYVDNAADQLDRFSDYLQRHSVHDIVGEVERFARREPALFLGGAFALGLLGARFLKSSGQGATNGRNVGERRRQTRESRYVEAGHRAPHPSGEEPGAPRIATPEREKTGESRRIGDVS